MKRLLLSLATIILLTSSIANPNLWTHQNYQQQPSAGKKATQEDAEDIANKLWNQSIKIDPNFWLGKDIQVDQTDFNKALVQNGFLTQDETQYVKWDSLNINQAGYFWNQGSFTVQKDGVIASGHATVDADVGETSKQIAAKIAASNVQLNYTYWKDKEVSASLTDIQSIFVNEKILTKAEASTIAGLSSPVTIKQPGKQAVEFNVNDNNTNTYADTSLNVVDDGRDASQIASGIQNTAYGLKTNTAGKYADDQTVTQNFQNLLVDAYGQNADDMLDVTLPHVKLQQDNKNMNAQVLKDGQIATAPVDIQCKSGSFIYYQGVAGGVGNYDFQAYVNLTPPFVNDLKTFFKGNPPSPTTPWNDLRLLYFYQLLCNGTVHYRFPYDFPNYSGPNLVPTDNILTKNMPINWGIEGLALRRFGDPIFDGKFLNALVNQVMANKDGYLSIMFHWHIGNQDRHTTSKYSFW